MKLSVFIQEHKEEITKEWISYAQEHIDHANHMNLEEVTDHVREILDRIVIDMQSYQTDDQQERKSKGNKHLTSKDREVGRAHGEQRVGFGFDFMQLSSEFRALRASILRLWAQKSREDNWETDFYDMIRFNEAIDEIWMVSLDRFQTILEESKNLFLGILGHDLRNPIATVKGANAILNLSENRTLKEKEILDLSNSSLKRMTELIDNLLELTELRLGSSLNMKKSVYDLQDRLEDIIHELQLAYPQTEINFDSAEALEGEWDILRVEQMVTNLITNAIRHGNEGGRINVKVSKEENEAWISVHNYGPPIPEEIQEKIFHGRFSRNNGSPVKEKSFGLGLLIVKEIVEGHEGEVVVNSKKEEGTTFTVKLPLKAEV